MCGHCEIAVGTPREHGPFLPHPERGRRGTRVLYFAQYEGTSCLCTSPRIHQPVVGEVALLSRWCTYRLARTSYPHTVRYGSGPGEGGTTGPHWPHRCHRPMSLLGRISSGEAHWAAERKAKPFLSPEGFQLVRWEPFFEDACPTME